MGVAYHLRVVKLGPELVPNDALVQAEELVLAWAKHHRRERGVSAAATGWLVEIRRHGVWELGPDCRSQHATRCPETRWGEFDGGDASRRRTRLLQRGAGRSAPTTPNARKLALEDSRKSSRQEYLVGIKAGAAKALPVQAGVMANFDLESVEEGRAIRLCRLEGRRGQNAPIETLGDQQQQELETS